MHSVQGILLAAGNKPVVSKGNCGIPVYIDGAIHYNGTPELMAEYALFACDAGPQIICGCCGTSPAHVAAMVTALDGTVRRSIDVAAITTAPGEAWAGLNTSGPAAGDKPPGGGRPRGRR